MEKAGLVEARATLDRPPKRSQRFLRPFCALGAFTRLRPRDPISGIADRPVACGRISNGESLSVRRGFGNRMLVGRSEKEMLTAEMPRCASHGGAGPG